jgi:excisionase family DNA binding protein
VRTISGVAVYDVDVTPPDDAPASPAEFPPVLHSAMAAELLQVHVEHLRRLVREDKIPCHRFPDGREMRFLRDELIDWLKAQPGADQSTSTGRARNRS